MMESAPITTLWDRNVVFAGTFNRSQCSMGVKKSGKGRRKLGRKKRRNRAKIRHRKD